MAFRLRLLRILGGVALAVAMALGTLYGQRASAGTASSSIPESTDAVLQQMTAAAGVIFAGQVVAIQRPIGYVGSGEDAAEGVVTIAFRVDNAVRGCVDGSIYTVKEWAGLWTGSTERYRVGQRLLMFLYSPDAHGLSSPVHGPEGAIPLRGAWAAPGPYDTTAVAGAWVVDLRWVQAQALRRELSLLGRSRRPAGGPIARYGGTVPEIRGSGNEKIVEQSEVAIEQNKAITPWISSPLESDAEMRPLEQVLSQCRSWIRNSNVSR